MSFWLAQLRCDRDMIQTAVAQRMNVSQARVSQIERQDVRQLSVSVVRRYVEALGGQLVCVAEWPDGTRVEL